MEGFCSDKYTEDICKKLNVIWIQQCFFIINILKQLIVFGSNNHILNTVNGINLFHFDKQGFQRLVYNLYEPQKINILFATGY